MNFQPPCLAFKIEAEAIKASSGLGNFFERAIVAVTHGKFCHVELWIDGPITSASCHASREPEGTSNQLQDLTQPYWQLVQLPYDPISLETLQGWAVGDSGRKYGLLTIGGIGSGAQFVHDPTDRICSEDAFLACRDIIRLPFPPEVKSWMVAPDGHPPNGWGLFELVEEALSKLKETKP
jgi:hypothetical protein